MSLTYAAGGGTAALTVVGLCMRSPFCHSYAQRLQEADLLFTGDGEAFNVGSSSDDVSERYLMVLVRLDSF